MPPLIVHDDQALKVAIALRADPALGADIGEAAERALATMRQVLPSRLRHRLDAVDVTTVGRPGEPGPPRRVESHHLVAVHGRWYLLGWDLEREDWRRF